MTKYFCDRCEREILNNTNCCNVQTEACFYENEFVVNSRNNTEHKLLCDRCECLLNKFFKNELDINYGPNMHWMRY